MGPTIDQPAVVALTSAVCQDLHVAERLQTTPDQLGMQPLGTGAWVPQIGARRGNPRLLPAPASSAQTLTIP